MSAPPPPLEGTPPQESTVPVTHTVKDAPPPPEAAKADDKPRDVDALKSQVATLEAAAMASARKIQELSDENTQLKVTVKALNDVAAQLRSELNQSKHAVPPAPADGATIENQSVPADNSGVDPADELNETKEKVRLLTAEKTALLDEISTLKVKSDEDLKKLQLEAESLRQGNSELDAKIASQEEEMKTILAAAAAKEEELQHTIESLNIANDELETKIAELEGKVMSVESEKTELVVLAQRSAAEVAEAKAEADSAREATKVAVRTGEENVAAAIAQCEAKYKGQIDQMLRITDEMPSPSLDEFRKMLLTEAEQQKLGQHCQSLDDENTALRSMMDSLLIDYTKMNEAATQLGQQLEAVQAQLLEERQQRDQLLRMKADDLEEVYASLLLRKQDELDALALRYKAADETIRNMLPATMQQQYFGDSSVNSPAKTSSLQRCSPAPAAVRQNIFNDI